ncbi:MAG: hypothetical protein M1469_04315 [Bacteroidetes bacterium]|nr:hypothetical protein [Bacteroidota bacterium]
MFCSKSSRDHASCALTREEVRIASEPIFLAGGINPENVRNAIESVRPYGIDVCAGVRSDGNLDRRKPAELFENIRG